MLTPSSSEPVCRCGYSRTHRMVEARPVFGFWAWFLLLNGASGRPKKVVYRCRRCGTILGETRERDVLEEWR